ncbi:uncharacterized protein LOC125279788 [Megalobrama amblycephala]|uniref:uncharacterized protein LOC125279788 n=1 Tax=Megalobrama amblycephala TaxID=75352 RepID=UPI002014743C|nr:uncharacterized protein LOC125279788 [Megalobrama amblycephala]
MFFRITSEFAVFTVIVYSVIFAYGWRKSAHYTNIKPVFQLSFVVLYRMTFGLSFVNIVMSCHLLSAVDFIKWKSWFLDYSYLSPDLILVFLKVINILLWPFCLLSKFKFEFKTPCQEWIKRDCFSCCKPQAFSWFKTSVFFIGIFILSWSQLFQLIFSFGLLSLGQWVAGAKALSSLLAALILAIVFMPFVQALLVIGLQVVPLLQSKFKCLCLRWITLLWIITITLLDIILVIYINLTILEMEKECVGWTCVIVFIEVLKMIVYFDSHVPEAERLRVQKRRQQNETSQKASNTLYLCNEIMYMFGAVGLVLLNSVTLTAELILKARNGERFLKDLRVIVFPSECVFALYWLGLQMHAVWKIVTTESTTNQRNSDQGDSPQLMNIVSKIYKRKNRSAPESAVSQKTVSEIYKKKNRSAPESAVSQNTVSEIYKKKNRSAPESAVSQNTVSEIYKKKNRSAPESAVSQNTVSEIYKKKNRSASI